MSKTKQPKFAPCPKCGNERGRISLNPDYYKLWFECYVCGFKCPANQLTKHYVQKRPVQFGEHLHPLPDQKEGMAAPLE